jgi:hypothetical protein
MVGLYTSVLQNKNARHKGTGMDFLLLKIVLLVTADELGRRSRKTATPLGRLRHGITAQSGSMILVWSSVG